MRSFFTVIVSVLTVAAVTSASANPYQYERDLFEQDFQQRDLYQRNAIEKGLYEREMYERAMFERELALRDMDPTRTINVARAISSATFQSDVADPVISAGVVVGAAFIPGAAGKVVGPAAGRVAANGYNHIASNKKVGAAANTVGHWGSGVGHQVAAPFHHHRRSLYEDADVQARDIYAREAEPEFEEYELYAREAEPEYEEFELYSRDAEPEYEDSDLYVREAEPVYFDERDVELAYLY